MRLPRGGETEGGQRPVVVCSGLPCRSTPCRACGVGHPPLGRSNLLVSRDPRLPAEDDRAAMRWLAGVTSDSRAAAVQDVRDRGERRRAFPSSLTIDGRRRAPAVARGLLTGEEAGDVAAPKRLRQGHAYPCSRLDRASWWGFHRGFRSGGAQTLLEVVARPMGRTFHTQVVDRRMLWLAAAGPPGYALCQGAAAIARHRATAELARPILLSSLMPLCARCRRVLFVLLGAHRARQAPGRRLKLSRFAVRLLTMHAWFDIGATRRDIGYEPIVGFRDGWTDMTAWFKDSPATNLPSTRHDSAHT